MQISLINPIISAVNSILHAGFAYGISKGIFAKPGIDLKLAEGRISSFTVESIKKDEAMFGYADASVMAKAVAEGAPLKMVANYVQTR